MDDFDLGLIFEHLIAPQRHSQPHRPTAGFRRSRVRSADQEGGEAGCWLCLTFIRTHCDSPHLLFKFDCSDSFQGLRLTHHFCSSLGYKCLAFAAQHFLPRSIRSPQVP